MSQTARITMFRQLHEGGCFVMPNPWDIGSARWLKGRGYKALATTSAGFAFTLGLADQDVPYGVMLEHIAQMVAAVPDIPVNADFENGYADEPAALAANVTACVGTGVAGLSIEDATGRDADPLYPFALAVERINAARAAIDATGTGVLLTARAEGVLVEGASALPDVLRRIRAFAEAGADVLYAPGLKAATEFAAVVAAAGGKPVNGLVFGDLGHSVGDLAALGIRRISIGAAMARAAWAGFMKVANEIAAEGTFTGFAENPRTSPLNGFFREDLKARP